MVLFSRKIPVGPLHDPVTWYGINYSMLGHKLHSRNSKTKELVPVQPGHFLCFESPTVYM